MDIEFNVTCFRYATILAFDVKVEKDAQELADTLHVKIFQADIIYHLFDKFIAYQDELKQKKRDEFKSIAVFPCKLKVSNETDIYLSTKLFKATIFVFIISMEYWQWALGYLLESVL